MLVSEAGRGSFGNPPGGGGRWLDFRIVFESAGLFHGRVINAGSRFPETMKWLCITSRLTGLYAHAERPRWLSEVAGDLN